MSKGGKLQRVAPVPAPSAAEATDVMAHPTGEYLDLDQVEIESVELPVIRELVRQNELYLDGLARASDLLDQKMHVLFPAVLAAEWVLIGILANGKAGELRLLYELAAFGLLIVAVGLAIGIWPREGGTKGSGADLLLKNNRIYGDERFVLLVIIGHCHDMIAKSTYRMRLKTNILRAVILIMFLATVAALVMRYYLLTH